MCAFMFKMIERMISVQKFQTVLEKSEVKGMGGVAHISPMNLNSVLDYFQMLTVFVNFEVQSLHLLL